MSQRDFNSKSNDNTIFCTSMCNNRCIMCCQPPQTHNDIKELYSENIQRINKAPKDLSLVLMCLSYLHLYLGQLHRLLFLSSA